MMMNRRNFVKKAGIGTAASMGLGTIVSSTACSGMQEKASDARDGQVLFIGENIAVADTIYGKVKGYVMNGIQTFLGIPYGADTSKKNRFMAPQKPEPWTDIRPAVFYGDTAPQIMDNRFPNRYSTFVDHWNYYDVSENCLMLNIWTPAIADGGKRPVLVWLHGGGFTNGNGIEHDGYHGENISRYGNIVYCSINHRLGPIGFSDLSGVGGEKYKDSGNVGMLDIVAALEWIKDNIANFGGDPGNVTVIGQSGGGAKVCAVAAMPSVKGLLHKGVSLSGSMVEAQSQDNSRLLGSYILKEAGLKNIEVDKLQEIPWREYLDIAYRALSKFNNENPATGQVRRGFAPVADGIHIPKGIFYSGQSDSPNIPMIFCTTFHEWNPDRDDASLEQITLEGVTEKIKGRFGDKAAGIVDAYAKNFPDLRPIELWAMIVSNRQAVVKSANAKLKQRSQVYMAWFGWQSPLFDNRMRAFHCSDICFWFANTDRMVTHTGGGARPRRLSVKMADALLHFMRNGDPNSGSLPQWPRYTEDNGEIMVLNDECSVQNDPDREARKSFV